MVVLLPLDPDALRIGCAQPVRAHGRRVGVIVSDSFGVRSGVERPTCIGAAGIETLRDLRGQRDPIGYELRSTQIALAARSPQLRSSLGQDRWIPVAIVRGPSGGKGTALDLLMPREQSLFS